jgi:hypothetical protein
MSRVTQLTVFVENRPGTLASVATALGNAGINILDFQTGTMGAAGYVQVIVDDVSGARAALQREGFVWTEQAVLYAELENVPGSLAALAAKLAAKNINIHSGYLTTMLSDTVSGVILAVSDIDAAVTTG